MFARFGHKWLCLHRGPVWQYEECEEREMGPVKSLVEIALDESGINLESLESGDVEVTVSQSEYEQSFNEDFLSHGESLEAMESTFHCLSLSGHPSDHVDSGELLRDDGLQLSSMDVPPVLPVHNGSSSIVHDCSRESEQTNVLGENQTFRVPHLWTHVTENDRIEMENGLISPKEMEKYHGIQPVSPRKSSVIQQYLIL